jgi:hypothetical protein
MDNASFNDFLEHKELKIKKYELVLSFSDYQ